MFKANYKIELRSAIIAGIVAVFVAAPLSNAATSQVVKIVRGKPGPQGPQGPAGPAGIVKVYRVTGTGVVQPGQIGSAGASCPAGTSVISTGYDTAPDADVRVYGVGAASLTSYAYLTVKNVGAEQTSVTLRVLCAAVQSGD